MNAQSMTQVLLAVAVIVVLAYLAGPLMQRIRQPAVVGQLVIGVVLGPSVLHGRLGRALVAPGIRDQLSLLGTLGVVLLTVLVALRLRPDSRREVPAAGRVAIGSVVVPLAAGAAVGVVLAGRYKPAGVGQVPFVLFVGAATAVTAFPVLARILAERGWETQPLGGLALSVAALGDLITWLLIAVDLSLAGAQGAHPQRLWLLIPLSAALLAMRRLLTGHPATAHTGSELGFIIAGAVATAALTNWIGLQTIFGAFAFGIAIPRPRAQQLAQRAEPAIGPIVSTVLLPTYFVLSGLKVDLTHLDSSGLTALGLIAVAAVGGKLVGVLIPARSLAMSWRDALTLASLLDTRGLTEIVVLTLGLQQHLIGTQLFSLMIVMAVGTTLLTGPALTWLTRHTPPPTT